MNVLDMKLLQEKYGLNIHQCKQVFSLMRKQGIAIDVAAKRVKAKR